MKKLFCICPVLLILFLFFSCQQKQEKTAFVIGLNSAPRHIDPRFAVDAAGQYMESLLYCSLFRFDQKGRTTPWVAKAFQWEDDQTLRVQISDQFKFSDGSIVKPEDIVATYQFLMRTDSSSPRKHGFKQVESVKKVNQETIEFKLKKTDAAFLTNLVVGILPIKAASEPQAIKKIENLSYCGPYQLKEKSDFDISLTVNPHYMIDKVSSTAQAIRFKVVKDERTRLSKIKAGEIDLLVNALSFDLLRFFEKIPPKNFTIQESSGLNTSYLAFNFKDPILKKPEVRKAIQLAIDRKEIIDSIYGGKAKLANSLLLKEDPFHLDIELQTRDQKLAGKLLDQAGYPDPDGTGPQKRFSLEYSTSTNSFRILVAKAIASQLESIGIEVKVVSKEWGKFKADIDQGKAQMWSLRWIGYKDPSIYHYAFSSESFPPNGGNRGYYSNSELDRLLNQGMIELDSSERKSIYKKVQKIIADDRPYIHLWHENNIALLRKEWSGFQLYADGRFDSIVRIQPKK